MIERPARNKILHSPGVVARAESLLLVKPVRFIDLRHIHFHPQPRPVGDGDQSLDNLERLFGQSIVMIDFTVLSIFSG